MECWRNTNWNHRSKFSTKAVCQSWRVASDFVWNRLVEIVYANRHKPNRILLVRVSAVGAAKPLGRCRRQPFGFDVAGSLRGPISCRVHNKLIAVVKDDS